MQVSPSKQLHERIGVSSNSRRLWQVERKRFFWKSVTGTLLAFCTLAGQPVLLVYPALRKYPASMGLYSEKKWCKSVTHLVLLLYFNCLHTHPASVSDIHKVCWDLWCSTQASWVYSAMHAAQWAFGPQCCLLMAALEWPFCIYDCPMQQQGCCTSPSDIPSCGETGLTSLSWVPGLQSLTAISGGRADKRICLDLLFFFRGQYFSSLLNIPVCKHWKGKDLSAIIR